MPRLTSGWPKVAERAASRTSQAIAISQPPPKASPLTAAIVVIADCSHSRESAWMRSRCARPESASHLVKALMSAPAQNSAGLAEASTIARAAGLDLLPGGGERLDDVRRERVRGRVVEPDDRDLAAPLELDRPVPGGERVRVEALAGLHAEAALRRAAGAGSPAARRARSCPGPARRRARTRRPRPRRCRAGRRRPPRARGRPRRTGRRRRRCRAATKPSVSAQRIGERRICWAKLAAACAVSGEVSSPSTISTMRGPAGWKPTTLSGRSVISPISVTESSAVLVARIARPGVTASSSAKTSCLRARSSSTASITKSTSPKPS